jgi:hypothetical protein
MYKLILLPFIVLLSFGSHAQDTLRKKDGTVLIGTVKEISESDLSFIRQDQPDGPIRRIPLYQVSYIHYKDGTREIFNVSAPQPTTTRPQKEEPTWQPGTVNETGKVVVIHRRGPDIRVNPGANFPTERALREGIGDVYIDFFAGYAETRKFNHYTYFTYEPEYLNYENLHLGARVGVLKYFGRQEKYRFGLNIQAAGFSFFLNDLGSGDVLFTPMQLGFASKFSLGEHAAMEFNGSGGVAVGTLFSNSIGIRYGADVRFRYARFAIGFDFSRFQEMRTNSNEFGNAIILVGGFRF